MLNSLQNLAWWHWWILAAVLAAVETFVPGVIAIWFAFAALVVGALMLLMDVPWPLQFVLFGLLGVVALVLWRWLRPTAAGDTSDQPARNQRGVHYIGEIYTVAEPIVSGSGKVRIGDTVWLARGGDAPLGARVRVVGVDGTVLKVESA
jgi:membrane protein implicated in regulation of membrane protease activity